MMRFALFYHSSVSDWNHGNAHFLRGIAGELQARGHEVTVYQPRDGWSLRNLCLEDSQAMHEFYTAFPHLQNRFYEPETLDLDAELDGVDVVIVHEWNEADLVSAIGRHHRRRKDYALLFHDTHHRSATAPEEMGRYPLDDYDGVLVFGDVIRRIYLDRGWASRVWTWHEAADTAVFRPLAKRSIPKTETLVWVGNWGDEERSEELASYLVEPVRRLKLSAAVYGVRYPASALHLLDEAGVEFRGWIPNYRVPEAFANASMTVHIPRRPYREHLPGIPTIRVFEALACGIPLVCLRWDDTEGLFRPGADYLQVDTPNQMVDCLHTLQSDRQLAERIAANGLETIRRAHTCGHRVDELLTILDEIRPRAARRESAPDPARYSSTSPVGASLR